MPNLKIGMIKPNFLIKKNHKMKSLKISLLAIAMLVAVVGVFASSNAKRVLCDGKQIFGALVTNPDLSDPADFTAPIDPLAKGIDWDCTQSQNVKCFYYRTPVPNTQPVQYIYTACPDAEDSKIYVEL